MWSTTPRGLQNPVRASPHGAHVQPSRALSSCTPMMSLTGTCQYHDLLAAVLTAMTPSDCSFKNLMMDASALHPLGHHPIQYDYLASDYSRRAPVLSRAVARVKYYFTDFGISTRFAPGAESRLVVGDRGLYRGLPELSSTVPYDPFKADVFLLGNVFREHFVEVSP